MAGFRTHITVSTALGVGYGAVAYAQFGIPAPTCLLAGTLCSVSGMLPDLDSDSGVPLREGLSFASACIPMLMLDRFRAMGWPTESIVLAGACIYAFVRFGIGSALKKYTVHRGMFHSIPAALIAGEAAFLVCSSGDIYLRAYKACAVVAGFMSHLILDEIWSVKVSSGGIGLKSSSGTAVKLWGDSLWANVSCYGKLAALGAIVLNDPIWVNVSPEGKQLHDVATTLLQRLRGTAPMPNFNQLPFGNMGQTTTTGGPTPNQTGPTQAMPWPNGAYPSAGGATANGPNYGPPTTYGPAPSVPQNYGYPPPYADPNYGVPTYPASTGAPQNYSPQNYGYGPPANGPTQQYPTAYPQPSQAPKPATIPYDPPQATGGLPPTATPPSQAYGPSGRY